MKNLDWRDKHGRVWFRARPQLAECQRLEYIPYKPKATLNIKEWQEQLSFPVTFNGSVA